MKLAVVRVRGIRKMAPRIKKTLELMLLTKPNHCVLVDDSPQNLGMLNVVKDYVTYGSVDEEIIYSLLYRKGKKGAVFWRVNTKEDEIRKAAKEIFAGKKVADYANPVFALKPPSKGYKNIKMSYPLGDLGKRDNISLLLKRMV